MITIEHIHSLKELVPLSQKEILEKEVRVFLWQHNFGLEELLKQSHLTPVELGIDTYPPKKEKRDIERLSIQLLVNSFFENNVKIQKLPSGRPYLAEEKLFISISHTKGVFALSISRHQHGIDVEQNGDKAMRVASMFTSAEELKRLGLLNKNQAEWFTTIWSAKEAIYKYYDIEGLSFKNHIKLAPSSSNPTPWHANCLLRGSQLDSCEIFYKQYPSFVLTCCSTASIIEGDLVTLQSK